MRKTLLIIDDEQSLCDLIAGLFEGTGKFKVLTATSGQKGLKYAKKYLPDIILLDITMPLMSGLEVLEELKDDEETLAIPVVMLTAHTEDEFRIKTASLYCEDYINKPFELADFVARIEKIVFKSEGYLNY